MGPRAVAAFTLVAFVVLGTSVGLAADGHGTCRGCHGLVSAASDRDREAAPGPVLCVTCHDLGWFLDHSDVIPAQDLDPRPGHFWPEAKRGAAQLDGEPQEAHCMACHDPHAETAPYLRSVSVDSGSSGSPIAPDPMTSLCLRCHAKEGVWGDWMQMRKHPVGVPVAEGLPEIGDTGLVVRRVDVAGTVDVKDDVVSCVTCHTVHERRDDDLLAWVGLDARTAACLSCHRLDGVPTAEEWLTARQGERGRGTMARLSAP